MMNNERWSCRLTAAGQKFIMTKDCRSVRPIGDLMSDVEVSHRDRCSIAGIGATEFSKDSGRSELTMAVQATLAALDDAGLTVDDVDGIVQCDHDLVGYNDLSESLGLRNSRATRWSGPAASLRRAWSRRRSVRS